MNLVPRAWSPSAILLLLFGVALVGVGIFFIVLRPPLLPEDMRFIGLSLAELRSEHPRMADWLLHVFRVLGGYAAAAGILTVTLAATSFRRHEGLAMVGALLGGAVSIGWMAIVNFVIDSDFKWILLGIALLWASAIAMFWIEGRTDAPRLGADTGTLAR
jgi:hypothetical protein